MLRPVRLTVKRSFRNPATPFCTICPLVALGRPDRGGSKKNVGQECPAGTAQVL